MADVHPTAVVDPAAQIASDVTIGPYCVVGPDVELGAGTVLRQHAVVEGHTQLGEGVKVYAFAVVGSPPQDMKYKGEESRLEVGAGTVIREHCTLNPGTEGGGLLTKVGSNCLLMVGAHVAHDCIVGDGVVMANNATLAGHVHVGDGAFVGGLSAVHQFSRIGQGAMIGGMSGVENDVIPYGMVMGNRARLTGLNVVGLRRRGISKSDLQRLRAAYQDLFVDRTGTFQERLDKVETAYGDTPLVADVINFIRAESDRSLCQPKAENDT